MSPAQPDLSVVIETSNTNAGDYAELARVLDALQDQSLEPGRLEIIVVADLARLAALEESLRRFDNVQLVDGPHLHYYAQKNTGAMVAKAPIVAFLDSDCLPGPTWAMAMLEGFETGGPSVGIVQGAVGTDHSTLGHAFAVTQHFATYSGETQRSIRSISGNNSAFRRADLVLDPFDEAPLFHGPEVRKAAMVLARGQTILFEPRATVNHRYLPGIRYFVGDALYWGYCFEEICRQDELVPHARLFRRLGILAPLVLVPAKAFVDLRLLLSSRQSLGASAIQTIAAAAALILHAFPVGIGAARCLMKLGPPAGPTTSNSHMAAGRDP